MAVVVILETVEEMQVWLLQKGCERGIHLEWCNKEGGNDDAVVC